MNLTARAARCSSQPCNGIERSCARRLEATEPAAGGTFRSFPVERRVYSPETSPSAVGTRPSDE